MRRLTKRSKRFEHMEGSPMPSPSRLVARALVVAALLSSFSSLARAGAEPGGDITFRLTLRGDVIDGDTFTLSVIELAEPPTIIGPGARCGPGSEAYNPQFVPCEPRTYEVVISGTASLPIGNQLAYAWARNYGPEGERQADIIYTDTITVTENAQVFTIVYDYGGTPLPNTALPATSHSVPLAVLAAIGSMLTACHMIRGRLGQSRP